MYKIPLSPIDLTKIYQQKQADKEFMLDVDYSTSKEKLAAKQILIYLANTGFKASFDKIDDELIKNYIELDFLVDSPLLERVVSNIIKVYFDEDPDDSLELYSKESIQLFISGNKDLVDDLINVISSMPAFCIDRMETFEDSKISFDVDLNVEYVEAESNVGLNIVNIITSGFDATLLVLSEIGMSTKIDSGVYNDKSKYNGGDIMMAFHDSGVVASVIELMPDDVICVEDEGSSK
jgi:hypothetical protein